MTVPNAFDLLEFVLFIFAFAGALLAAASIGAAYDELQSLLLSKRNGLLKLLAYRHLITPIVYGGICLVNLVAMGIAVFIPTPPDPPISFYLYRLAFVLTELLAVGGVVYTFRTRQKIMALAHEHENAREAKNAPARQNPEGETGYIVLREER